MSVYIKAHRPLWWNCQWRRQSHQATCTCNLGVVCNSYATQTVISHSGYNSSTVVTMSRENSGEIIFTRIRVNVYVYGFHARVNAGIENRHFRTWSRARFSKVSVINGPGKSLLLFQINVSIVFRITLYPRHFIYLIWTFDFGPGTFEKRALRVEKEIYSLIFYTVHLKSLTAARSKVILRICHIKNSPKPLSVVIWGYAITGKTFSIAL